MNKKKWVSRILLIAVVMVMSFCVDENILIRECPEIELVDRTDQSGLSVFQITYGVAVADINNDGRDDLVISNHLELPSLFINRGGFFEDLSEQFPERIREDIHGVTAVDLENDGDRDLVFAGGGADGVGVGCANRLYKNLFSDTGNLAFEDITAGVNIEYQPWRSRHFLPLASGNGSMIDLFLVCLVRESCPDLYFSNLSYSDIHLELNESPGLNKAFSSEGRDIFFDFDRDGDQDLLIVSKSIPYIYDNINNVYHKSQSLIPEMASVFCVEAGDLNNDGYPDLYLGREAMPTESDNISSNSKEIHFVVRKHDADISDGARFNGSGGSITIDFIQHLPSGETILDPSDIFIGQQRKNPEARRATIPAATAEGEPVRDFPGTYIWKDLGVNLWHVEWVYTQERKDKGKITAESISNLVEENLETFLPVEVNDRIYINQNGNGFIEMVLPELIHQRVTRAVTMCDLNNDGFIDIVGLRGGEPGMTNGDPFVLINCGDLNFVYRNIMQNTEDDIFQADQLVHGFFDDDGLPDIFFTNGFGLNPGHVGPYKLYLNKTQDAGQYVILELEGRSSNRDALGASVELYSRQGTFLGFRQLGMGWNRSQSTHKIHFGMGQTEDEIVARIKWPGTTDWDEREVEKNRINHIVQ